MGRDPRCIRRQISADALVYVDSRKFSCSALEIDERGLLLLVPTRIGVGKYVRVHLYLPRDEIVDVEGLVTDETQASGYRAWRVRFARLERQTREAIAAFTRGARPAEVREFTEEAPIRRVPTGPMLPAREPVHTVRVVGRPVAGPAYPPAPRPRHTPTVASSSEPLPIVAPRALCAPVGPGAHELCRPRCANVLQPRASRVRAGQGVDLAPTTR